MNLIIFFILLSPSTLALIYNDPCTKKCDLPGLICQNNRCVCDFKSRLFWTNARCAPCPNDWTMTETACIAFYETIMPWENAKSTCRNLNAELISFHNRDLIPLIYTATNKNPSSGAVDKFTAWTSAHATNAYEIDTYQWLDQRIPRFNSKSDWWCRKSTPHLGYAYQYDKPTRHVHSNTEIEACVVYRRGMTATEVVCLDDQLCSLSFPFVCEKSESTANQYLGPPPATTDLSNATTSARASIVHTIPSGTGTVIINTAHWVQNPKAAHKGPSSSAIVFILIIALFMLLLLIVGLLFFSKRRNAKNKRQVQTKDTARDKRASSAPRKSDGSTNDPITTEESVTSDINISEPTPVNTVIPIDPPKQQKNKRGGGYSKQQFDEFE